jgi:hypothetical protein
MSVVYSASGSDYDKGFAIGYENIRVMYHDQGCLKTIGFIEAVENECKKQNDEYHRGYLDGCVKAFNNIHNRAAVE